MFGITFLTLQNLVLDKEDRLTVLAYQTQAVIVAHWPDRQVRGHGYIKYLTTKGCCHWTTTPQIYMLILPQVFSPLAIRFDRHSTQPACSYDPYPFRGVGYVCVKRLVVYFQLLGVSSDTCVVSSLLALQMVIATNIYHFENNAYSTSQIEVIFVRFGEFSI